MRLWRICSRRHLAFDDEGARLSGGRWSRRGTRVVYTSSTLSLAALETLVHTDTDLLPQDLVAIGAEVPDDVGLEAVDEASLPPNWREYPAPEALQELGTNWVGGQRTLVLSVPSAVLPQERNYLLNPHHPDFERVHISSPEPFRFDPRVRRRK